MTQCGPASPHSVEIHHGVASLGVHQSQVVENNVKKVILVIFDGHLEAVVSRVENISLCLRVKYSDGRSAFDLEMINCRLWSGEEEQSHLVPVTRLVRTVNGCDLDDRRPGQHILRQGLPDRGEPLTVTTPVIVELNQPESLAVVQTVHGVVVDVDNLRVVVERDEAGTLSVLHPEGGSETGEKYDVEASQRHAGHFVTKAYNSKVPRSYLTVMFCF